MREDIKQLLNDHEKIIARQIISDDVNRRQLNALHIRMDVHEILNQIEKEKISLDKFLERALRNMKKHAFNSVKFELFLEKIKKAIEIKKDLSKLVEKNKKEKVLAFLTTIAKQIIGDVLSTVAETLIDEIVDLIKKKS